MSKQNNLHDFLTDLANSIREAEGSTEPINPQEFSDRVKALGTGGGSGGESGVPIKVTSLPTPTKQDVGKVYLVDTKVTPEVGQVVGDKLYFDTSKNPLDYSLGSAIIMGETQEGVHCTYVDFFALQGITGMGHCYAIGVATPDMSVFLGMPYVYCDMLTVEQFNTNVGAPLGLSITEFGWQTDVVDITSIQDRKITYVSETIDLAKVKGGEYYVGTGGNTFRLNEPVGDKIYFDTTKNPTDYLAFIDQNMLELSNGTNSNFLAMMDYAPAMSLTDVHIYALFLSDETGGLLGLAYLDTANTLTLEQINEMLAPAFGMSLEKFGWQTDVLDTSAFADYEVTENNLALWDFLAYGNAWYEWELSNQSVVDELKAQKDAEIANVTAQKDAEITELTKYKTKKGDIFFDEQIPESCMFAGWNGANTITLSNNVRQTRQHMFCNSYVDVKWESENSSMTSIMSYTFGDWKGSAIELPPSIVDIGGRAFDNCYNLVSITIKATTPPTLGGKAFEGCRSLTAIYVPAASVDTYKAASGWSDYADIIQAIAE